MMNRKIMKRDSRKQAVRAVAAAVLVESIAAVAGCSLIVSGLEVPNETSSTGGSAGTGGVGGSTSSGGMGGFAGSAGNGGVGNQAGKGGESGHAGNGGEAGFGGVGGEAGAGGIGGFGGAGGSGTVCPGVFNETVTTSLFSLGVAKPVGGYDITFTGENGSGINVDIECAANQAVVAQGIYCNEGGPEVQVNVSVDSKRVKLYDINNNASAASMNVTVENL